MDVAIVLFDTHFKCYHPFLFFFLGCVCKVDREYRKRFSNFTCQNGSYTCQGSLFSSLDDSFVSYSAVYSTAIFKNLSIVCACISATGVGDLLKADGIMNTEMYYQILIHHYS